MAFVDTEFTHHLFPANTIVGSKTLDDKSFPRYNIDLTDVSLLAQPAGSTHKVDIVLVVAPVQSQPVLPVKHRVDALVIRNRVICMTKLIGYWLIPDPEEIIHEDHIHLLHSKWKVVEKQSFELPADLRDILPQDQPRPAFNNIPFTFVAYKQIPVILLLRCNEVQLAGEDRNDRLQRVNNIDLQFRIIIESIDDHVVYIFFQPLRGLNNIYRHVRRDDVLVHRLIATQFVIDVDCTKRVFYRLLRMDIDREHDILARPKMNILVAKRPRYLHDLKQVGR